ncbi:integrase [Halorhodospira abdelmalekii]|uniref:IS607 family transposase n=1 Tax=Halorhodospira abdelmalekii TaxID=421629 RepID=UPI0019069010|nr:IS607 family transposase [Halorhodospira abdelmalekii]MBK1734433.1 integrase [Halorhodospira abdelmalekii]
MKSTKLSAWAKQKGIAYRTAWNWYKSGRLPAHAYQTPTGTILVEVDDEVQTGRAALYARVSSHDQKPQLDGQIARCLAFANGAGLSVVQTVTEVGSGLNGHRKKLLALLADPKVDVIVVEHRDRLMRFGAEYVEAALAARGARLLVVDAEELTDDLVADMIAVLTSFCARLYGRRSAANRAKRLVAQCQNDPEVEA